MRDEIADLLAKLMKQRRPDNSSGE